jgi:hypothetical protein
MSDDYAKAIDGFEIGPESLACGLAPHSGKAVLTPDVRRDSRREKWIWLADEFKYRGYWSFPVHTTDGRLVGTFAVYWPAPREATPQDLERIRIVVQTAAMIISRYQDEEQRHRDDQTLGETGSQIESELADGELLRQLSLELLDEADESKLFGKLVEAVATIMQSEACTVQVFHPERVAAGKLQMLASRGLPPAGMKFWEWVRAASGCTCGEVLRTGRRVRRSRARPAWLPAGWLRAQLGFCYRCCQWGGHACFLIEVERGNSLRSRLAISVENDVVDDARSRHRMCQRVIVEQRITGGGSSICRLAPSALISPRTCSKCTA